MLDITIIDFAGFLADEARKITGELFRSGLKVDSKSDGSPVTEADKKVETMVRQLVKNNLPTHAVFGEEFENQNTDKEFLWVVDPIDGTKSFITGRPIFGTLLALLHNGKPVLGLIDQPITEERWLAVDGETKFNNEIVKTRKCKSLDKAVFGTTDPNLFDVNEQNTVRSITNSVKDSVYGGDCYLYGQIALGQLDLVVESGLKPFDFLPLVPVIENAGGKITDWSGNDLNLHSQGDVIACGDKDLHAKVLKFL